MKIFYKIILLLIYAKRISFTYGRCITTTFFLNIGIVTEIFAQEVEEENSFSLSEKSIEEAQDNVTELTANKTGFEEEDTVGLSGRSIEEAKK
jgi:hypothetical protein